jgi:hypothetical protein
MPLFHTLAICQALATVYLCTVMCGVWVRAATDPSFTAVDLFYHNPYSLAPRDLIFQSALTQLAPHYLFRGSVAFITLFFFFQNLDSVGFLGFFVVWCGWAFLWLLLNSNRNHHTTNGHATLGTQAT